MKSYQLAEKILSPDEIHNVDKMIFAIINKKMESTGFQIVSTTEKAVLENTIKIKPKDQPKKKRYIPIKLFGVPYPSIAAAERGLGLGTNRINNMVNKGMGANQIETEVRRIKKMKEETFEPKTVIRSQESSE